MSGHAKDTAAEGAADQADDAMSQIARLRAQMDTLIRDKVNPAIETTTERVEAAARDAAELMRERSDAVAATVREHPLTSVLIAAAIGFLLGRTGR
jgi:ElaB/YqjD/DUF883 family membrane-anchored ribosome-binding protein